MIRIIARLDVKGPNLIKSINLEGLRALGPPAQYALNYYNQGVDELLFVDSVASLYGRKVNLELVSQVAQNIFIPLTVSGGVSSVNDACDLLNSGADKIAINTAAVHRPALLKELASELGSQSVVLSIDAKLVSEKSWEVFTHNGREPTGLCVIDWLSKASDLGAGEILLTSIDKEGTKSGFDMELLKAVRGKTSLPVISSGGFKCPQNILDAVFGGMVDATAIADALHYNQYSINQIKSECKKLGLDVRWPMEIPQSLL